MMYVKFDFCTMYEPGEDSPPQITQEASTYIEIPALPRFKDQVVYGGRHYFIWDVIFVFNNNKAKIKIKAVRKVSYPPSRGDDANR